MRKSWWIVAGLTGATILFGASPLGRRTNTDSPAPATPVASVTPARTGPAEPRSTVTPDDPRLHEEPVETDDTDR